MRFSKSTCIVTLGVALVACSSDDAAPSNTSSSSTSSSSSGSSSGGASSSGGSSTSSGGSSSGSPGEIDGIPAGDPTAFNAWLQKKEYEAWPKESAAHASTGPHGASVRTYLNPKLDASLTANNAEHPRGSAAVKEFLSNDQVTGWAAYLKTQDASDGGAGWYWYEVFETTPGATPIEGQGKSTCTGCHSAGRDFVRIPHPLN